jgi:hypothetical protein
MNSDQLHISFLTPSSVKLHFDIGFLAVRQKKNKEKVFIHSSAS